MTTKLCTKCKTEKGTEEFRYLVAAGRHHSWCKQCERESQRKKHVAQNKARNAKSYAIRAIRNYVARYGKDIIEEALRED